MSMHVAISGWLLGPHSGANQRLLATLAEVDALLAEDERITVLHGPTFTPPSSNRIAWLPVAIPMGPTWRRAVREQSLVPMLLRELGATVYDHGFLPPPRVSMPTCLTIHDLRAADGHTIWPRMLARSVLRKACRRADTIITPSNYTRERLHGIVPATVDKTVVAANAVRQPLPQPQPPDALPQQGYLLHVGHLETRKNLAVTIRALALLPKATAPELWLVGRDAGQGRSLKRLAEQLGIAAQVRQLGTVDDATLQTLYAHARAFVMPSIYEGFGIPALEGLAHGLPVLASNTTALPEILGGHACLLPPEQPEAWAEAMQRAMSEPLAAGYSQLIERRRSYGRNHFTWRQTAETYLTVWREQSGAGSRTPATR